MPVLRKGSQALVEAPTLHNGFEPNPQHSIVSYCWQYFTWLQLTSHCADASEHA